MSIQGWGFVDMWEGENFWVAVPGVGYGNRQVACVAELGHHNVSFPGCLWHTQHQLTASHDYEKGSH